MYNEESITTGFTQFLVQLHCSHVLVDEEPGEGDEPVGVAVQERLSVAAPLNPDLKWQQRTI